MASDRLWRNRNTRIVVLDTSAAMIPFEFLLDIEDELTRILGKYKIVVPSSVYDELLCLSDRGKGRKKRFAKQALNLIKDYEKIDTDGIADDDVLKVALDLKGIVFTNDRELRKRAKKNSLKTIYLRSKKKLELN